MTMSEYYTLPIIKQKCSELKERIEVLREKSSTLIGEITDHMCEDINQCFQNVGKLENTFKNTHEMMEEQNGILNIAISHIERLVNGVEFFNLSGLGDIIH